MIEIGQPPPLNLVFLGAVEIPTSLSVYIEPSVLAHFSADPAPSWWPDYLRYAAARLVHFIPDTELLKDQTTWHPDRLWDHDCIIVPKDRINDVITTCRLLDIWESIAPSVSLDDCTPLIISADVCSVTAEPVWHASSPR